MPELRTGNLSQLMDHAFVVVPCVAVEVLAAEVEALVIDVVDLVVEVECVAGEVDAVVVRVIDDVAPEAEELVEREMVPLVKDADVELSSVEVLLVVVTASTVVYVDLLSVALYIETPQESVWVASVKVHVNVRVSPWPVQFWGIYLAVDNVCVEEYV
jgi:hypothetical protein